ncbi:MAG: PhnD/SsuA/transferrin family substrate-binding protein [bacterium]
MLTLLSFAVADVRNIISFYNPETNISSFTSLKISYDEYLAKHTDYRLQPFKDRNTFESLNASKNNPVMLISSWHYRNLDASLKQKIKPALVATQKGAITTQKVLATKKSIESLKDLEGKVIASSADAEYTRELMFDLFRHQPRELVESIKVLTVPKEIDALMSVAYGVADAAITYESTLQKLEKINPNQSALLHSLVKSEQIMLPLLFVPHDQQSGEQKLVKVLEDMPNSQEGRQQLRMIGIDGWKPVDDQILEQLEKYSANR